MKTTKPTPSFRVLDASSELISALVPVVASVGRHDRSLRDQLRRAATSIPLHLAEGFGQQGGHKKQRFSTALGSAREVTAILEVARRWQYVSVADAADAARLLDSVAA
ncbi:MAG: four helix bundle protein, partial [Polyangiales bacterium]